MSHKQRAVEAICHIRDANKQPADQRIASLVHIRDMADRAAQSLVPKLQLDAVTARHVEREVQDTTAAMLRSVNAVIDAEAKAVAAELEIREDYAAPTGLVAEAMKEYMGVPPKPKKAKRDFPANAHSKPKP